ncbi:GNAT domain-containing protein [Penicillium longicatenatum]|uniref:GNAT domain-containing protein n=1 Tax=Penicillium longicatenatum TaxID=1561947 RepID=UPI002547AA00|nr:GNAT domain-containing protein [Penicillium longicatenatum]KAJ5644036.1 GNAT domain-containing protein [Penicillium longicatenatum]KAJ5644590.1 GNAT domain-containing protein [Penicillium longicatenatum]
MEISLQDLLPPYSKTQPINTPRLTLRPFQWTDLQSLYKLRTTSEVMQWTSQVHIDSSIQQTREWMQRYIDDTEIPRRNFNFVITLRADKDNQPDELSPNSSSEDSSAIIGVCGLTGLDSLPISPLPSFGYMFLPNTWGKGYATEAAVGFQREWKRLIDLGHQTHSIPLGSRQDLYSIRAVTLATNIPSANVLRKCGWRTYEAIEENGEKLLRWVLDTSASSDA